MKKMYAILAIACAPFGLHAQCSIQVSTTNVSCYTGCDGQATAQMTGTPPYTYSWMPIWQTGPTVTNLCEGMYQVDGTDATGCVASMMINITQRPTLNVVFISYAASCQSCCNGSIALTVVGGTPPYSFSWTPSVGSGPNVQSLCPGTYSCCVTDANGCVSCNSYPVGFNTGIDDPAANESLFVFPAVATERVQVKGNFVNTVPAQLSVINMLGETVFTKSVESVALLDETIEVGTYEAGMYLISITTAEGTSVSRFLKE